MHPPLDIIQNRLSEVRISIPGSGLESLLGGGAIRRYPIEDSLPALSVYLGAPIWWDKALSRSKVDGCVPETQHGNLIIVRQRD